MESSRGVVRFANARFFEGGSGTSAAGQYSGACPQLRGGRKKSTAEAQSLGRSRGGLSTKIHALTDALGNPLKLILTAGQAADICQAEALLAGYTPQSVIADRGDDSNQLLNHLQEKGITPVIPPRSHRIQPRPYDRWLYRERHLIECFFNKIKHYRRVFSRFEKTARHYMSFLQLVATLCWLR